MTVSTDRALSRSAAGKSRMSFDRPPARSRPTASEIHGQRGGQSAPQDRGRSGGRIGRHLGAFARFPIVVVALRARIGDPVGVSDSRDARPGAPGAALRPAATAPKPPAVSVNRPALATGAQSPVRRSSRTAARRLRRKSQGRWLCRLRSRPRRRHGQSRKRRWLRRSRSRPRRRPANRAGAGGSADREVDAAAARLEGFGAAGERLGRRDAAAQQCRDSCSRRGACGAPVVPSAKASPPAPAPVGAKAPAPIAPPEPLASKAPAAPAPVASPAPVAADACAHRSARAARLQGAGRPHGCRFASARARHAAACGSSADLAPIARRVPPSPGSGARALRTGDDGSDRASAGGGRSSDRGLVAGDAGAAFGVLCAALDASGLPLLENSVSSRLASSGSTPPSSAQRRPPSRPPLRLGSLPLRRRRPRNPPTRDDAGRAALRGSEGIAHPDELRVRHRAAGCGASSVDRGRARKRGPHRRVRLGRNRRAAGSVLVALLLAGVVAAIAATILSYT